MEDWGAWHAAGHGVTKSQAKISDKQLRFGCFDVIILMNPCQKGGLKM